MKGLAIKISPENLYNFQSKNITATLPIVTIEKPELVFLLYYTETAIHRCSSK